MCIYIYISIHINLGPRLPTSRHSFFEQLSQGVPRRPLRPLPGTCGSHFRRMAFWSFDCKGLAVVSEGGLNKTVQQQKNSTSSAKRSQSRTAAPKKHDQHAGVLIDQRQLLAPKGEKVSSDLGKLLEQGGRQGLGGRVLWNWGRGVTPTSPE